MEYTGLNELREKYLSFFVGKGHVRLQSSSLVPHDDKSILLINAGMTPMKKFFTGEMTPPAKRVTTCQKCIRTPDIENVGKTARHGTFFEMLGNFSFGDYFKEEAISWAWEFFTEELEIPKELLHVSVYLDDDEAYDIWTNKMGVDPSHVVRMGKEDNFWEHGAGPCGPCSEIYFDRGPDKGCGRPDCHVGCECDRFVEVWNLVFTQFENDGNGNYTRLAHPNIDTGMGLERLACVMQGADNIFEVDTIQSIMSAVINVAGIKYHENEKADVSLRVITDHIRSTVFMIGDGVLPSNVGRGYVLRRLLRRAARHGKLIGINKPFLADLVSIVIEENSTAYPDLVEKEEYITKVISMEEESFLRTIDAGMGLLTTMTDHIENGILKAKDAFKLQDTYGFPIDLTKEILAEKGLHVDEEGFRSLLDKARQMSRSARKNATAEAWRDTGATLTEIEKTEFICYYEYSSEGTVLAIISDGEKREFITPDDSNAVLILDKTPFYAESGGQTGDKGTITVGETVFQVENTTKTADGIYLHSGSITQGDSIVIGATALAEIDVQSRLATARNHTSAHLLQATLRKTLGDHVTQAGQLVNPQLMRFDFTHFAPLTGDELMQIELDVNNVIMSATPVTTQEMSLDEAKAKGAMALFSDKYGDTVRVVSIGDYSMELCGGTHVQNTGQIGLFHIISESSVAAGVRRIEAVTGTNFLSSVHAAEGLLSNTAHLFKVSNPRMLLEKAQGLLNTVNNTEKELATLRDKIAKQNASDLLHNAVDVNGVNVVIKRIEDNKTDEIKSFIDTVRADNKSIVVIAATVNPKKGTVSFACGCDDEAIARGAHAGKIVKEIAALASGSGGGKPDMAMAGGKDITKTDEALSKALDIVKKYIK